MGQPRSKKFCLEYVQQAHQREVERYNQQPCQIFPLVCCWTVLLPQLSSVALQIDYACDCNDLTPRPRRALRN